MLVVGFTIFHHEMWRDEIDAWLVARDSTSPSALLWNIRYAGHPSLWYLLLWPLTRITRNLHAMQALNLVLAAATAFIVAKYAPAPRWIRAAAVFGYFPVYEYGSIARNYMLGVLGLAVLCASFPRRHQRPVLLGVLVAGIAHTVPHATVLAFALLAVLATEALLDPPVARARGTWIGLGIAAAGLAVAAWQMKPPPDSGFAPGWFLTFDPERARTIVTRVIRAYVPLAQSNPGFWNTEFLRLHPWYDAIAPAVGIGFVVWIALALVRKPLACAYYLVGSMGLLAFFYLKYDGSLRHHGYLFVCLATALWLARALPAMDGWGSTTVGVRFAESSLVALVPLLLGIHVVGAMIAVSGDYRYTFSGAKATAELMRRAGIDRLPMVGDEDYAAMAVVGYLDKDRAYYPADGRYGSHIVWDTRRLGPYDLWADAASIALSLHSAVTVVVNKVAMSRSPTPGWLMSRLQLVGCREARIIPDETFCVFLLEAPRFGTSNVMPGWHTGSRGQGQLVPIMPHHLWACQQSKPKPLAESCQLA